MKQTRWQASVTRWGGIGSWKNLQNLIRVSMRKNHLHHLRLTARKRGNSPTPKVWKNSPRYFFPLLVTGQIMLQLTDDKWTCSASTKLAQTMLALTRLLFSRYRIWKIREIKENEKNNTVFKKNRENYFNLDIYVSIHSVCTNKSKREYLRNFNVN